MARSVWKICLSAGRCLQLKSKLKCRIQTRSKMHKAQILVIDDEVKIRRLLQITLQSNDFEVISAGSGSEGIAMVAQHPPDLILLDLGLPDISGHEVLKHLREWYSKP